MIQTPNFLFGGTCKSQPAADGFAKGSGAKNFQGKPKFQSAKRARQFGAVVEQIPLAFGILQVGGIGVKRSRSRSGSRARRQLQAMGWKSHL